MFTRNINKKMKIGFDNKVFTSTEFSNYYNFLYERRQKDYIYRTVDVIENYLNTYCSEDIEYYNECYEMFPLEIQQEVTNLISKTFLNLMEQAIIYDNVLRDYYVDF